MAALLEHDLGGELQFARGPAAGGVIADGGGDGAEVGSGDIGVWRAELGSIQHVEQIGTETQIQLLSEINEFGESRIELGDAGGAKGVAAQVAEGLVSRRQEGGGIDPVIRSGTARRRERDSVDLVGTLFTTDGVKAGDSGVRAIDRDVHG